MNIVEVAPYWNVNYFETAGYDNKFGGRSSSILECKSTFYFSITFYFFVEVAPYWNVNVSTPEAIIACISVEVAPYWNVNYKRRCIKFSAYSVEVAPYWNVNFKYCKLNYKKRLSVEVAPYWNVNLY